MNNNYKKIYYPILFIFINIVLNIPAFYLIRDFIPAGCFSGTPESTGQGIACIAVYAVLPLSIAGSGVSLLLIVLALFYFISKKR